MKLSAYIAAILLLFAPAAFAANASFANAINAQVGQAINVAWPSSSINLSQLQGLTSQYPGASQFNIQFPNNTTWGVTPSSIQNIAGNYMQQAQTLGYRAGIPNLSFSSLRNASFDSNMLSIPIANLSGSLQDAVDGGLRELRYQQMHLSDSLPDWLKNSILWVWNMLAAAWDWAAPQLAALFR